MTDQGTISKVKVEGRFGFIRRPGLPDVFFHANSLVDVAFGEQLQEMRVAFEVVDSAKGPRACNVRPLD